VVQRQRLFEEIESLFRILSPEGQDMTGNGKREWVFRVEFDRAL
jgi:hypothetical protein